MAKAKLTTRGISSSTVTSDNLAKGSQLTHNQLDSNFINLRDQTFGIAADDSATIQVGAGDTLYIQGGSNVTTSTDSAGVVTINATGEVTASSTTTFTNKTFDANGSGNSLSNVEVADFAAASIVTEAEGISSNDNDTTLPTSAAVKDLVDTATANTGDITFVGSTINSPSNADISLQPGGTGAVTMPGITIDDNKIFTNRSSDDLVLDASGTGKIVIGGGGIDVNQTDITSNSNHWVRIQPEGTGVTQVKNLVLSDNSGEGGISSARMNLEFEANNDNFLQVYRTNVLLGGSGQPAPVHSGGQIRAGEYVTAQTFNPGSTSNETFKFDQYGLTSYDTNSLTMLLSGAVRNANTSDDTNILQLYFKKVNMPNHNVTFKIGNEGNLVFQADAGTPHITLYEYADDGKIEIMPKAGKEVFIDGVQVLDNTISSSSSNANLELGTSGSGTLELQANTNVTGTLGVTGASTLDGVTITDNTISTNASNANLEISANGSGKVSISGIKYPTSDGSADQVLKTDGSGNLSFVAQSGGASTGDITFVGSTMISPSNADITLNPAGTGKVNINAVYTLPNADGSANQVLGTNGSGVLSFRDPTAINIDGGVADSTYTSVPTIDGGTA